MKINNTDKIIFFTLLLVSSLALFAFCCGCPTVKNGHCEGNCSFTLMFDASYCENSISGTAYTLRNVQITHGTATPVDMWFRSANAPAQYSNFTHAEGSFTWPI
jgi:hypothetical protein